MKRFVLFFSILMLSAAGMNAQQKVAHVDSDAIIPLMPEYQRAKSEVEAYSKQLQKQLESKQTKMQQYYQQVMAQAEAGTLTAAAEQEAQTKLMQMQEDLQKAAAQADESLMKKEAELTKPMYERFDAALKTMCKAQGYSYVFDKKLLLYYDGGIDATSKLKAQLGL